MMFPNPIEQFFTWQTLIFGIAISMVTRAIRRLCEMQWPNLVGHLYWGDIVLPTVPVLVGIVGALSLAQYPFPACMHTPLLRAFLGAVVGYMSAWMYRVLKAMVKRTWGVDISMVPPAGSMRPPHAMIPPPPRLPQVEDEEVTKPGGE